MKKILYKLINKLGFRIENKKKIKKLQFNYFNKFQVKDNLDLLYDSEEFIRSIESFFPNLKIIQHENGFIIEFGIVKIYVESVEEFFIINEVFIEKDYNFVTNSKATVIDIGGNIGIASIFFSTLENVENIYLFEPVIDTFNQAKFNISLNKSINKVSSLNNFGLGNKNRMETFIYNKSIKGNTGIRGARSSSYAANLNNITNVEVQIKSSSEIIKNIIEKNSKNTIVVKIDCEGAEYEIFENLSNSGVISFIDIFMIEWHDNGAKVIEDILKKFSFNYFSRNLGTNSGMIYAYKQ